LKEIVMRQLPVAAVAVLFALATACGDNHAGSAKPDASVSVDAAIDGPPIVGDGIAAARAAADGAGLALGIRGGTVTYLKPLIGAVANDPAGFTIQADKAGPALFVAVDPATLTPPAAVGDVVNFTITMKGTVAMQPRALAITAFTRTATGANVGALAQDLTAATNVVSAVDGYDSELVSVTGTLFEVFASSGTGFQRSGLSTTGSAADTNLQVRAPATLIDALDMTKDCQITITNVPMGRFNAQAQIGVFKASDFQLTSCPAPVVVKAVALSLTSLRITFSRNILASSVMADGSQFTFDNGLTASAAVVSGRTITLTTSLQTAATAYLATIAASITDLQGKALAAAGTASFTGFVLQAVVRINEVNANIAGGCDLIELRVIADGSMTGFKLFERTGAPGVAGAGELSLTFPSFSVHKNDLIVVHMNAGTAAAATVCNPNHATEETTTVTDQASAAFPGNFDTAFDFWAIDTGLTATDNVFTLFDVTGTINDAVFISDDPAGPTAAAATETQAAVIGAAGQWSPILPAYIDTVFRLNAASDLNATGTTAAGTSIQRIDDTDNNDKADWTTGAGAAPTWGALNAGQTAIP
jgi:Bacterial Ig-like domain